ncbi:hypothetical protein Tco_1036243, partial [Tanacetum coccineum]
MNPNYDENEYVSKDDNESNIWFMTKALELHEMMVQEEMGETSQSRQPIHCEYALAEERLMRDYFGDHPKYPEWKGGKGQNIQRGKGGIINAFANRVGVLPTISQNTPSSLIHVGSSIKIQKVFEDKSRGIVCYIDDKGEITCEGFDEGPRLHQGVSTFSCYQRVNQDIVDLLNRSWLQVIDD